MDRVDEDPAKTMTINTILLTGANGDISTAIGRALGEGLPGVRLVGCDTEGEWPGLGIFEEMFVVPHADDTAYMDALRTISSNANIDLIIPCTEPEIKRLTNEDCSGLRLLINDTKIVHCCLDKLETARWLEGLGLPVPATQTLATATDNDLPVMVKPRTGSGSRDLEVVVTPERLAVVRAERSDSAIAQQLLDPHEGEFTCPIFKACGEVRTLIMRRWLSGGLTGRVIVEDIPAINDVLQTVASALPDIAAINVQLRLVDGVPMVFEINPRLSSTVMMRHLVGFSDALWWVGALAGEAPPKFSPPLGTKVFRTYGELKVTP